MLMVSGEIPSPKIIMLKFFSGQTRLCIRQSIGQHDRSLTKGIRNEKPKDQGESKGSQSKCECSVIRKSVT